MALLSVDYIKRRMSPSTFLSIFDDDNLGDGTYNADAVTDIIADAEAEVYSWVARNYPNLTVPQAGAPPTLRMAAFGFFYVFARDRKPEYWSKAQESERKDRLKAAYELVERFAKAGQILYDTNGAPPANVGGTVRSGNPFDTDPKPKFFVDGTDDF